MASKAAIKALTAAREALHNNTNPDQYEGLNEAVVNAEKQAGPLASMRGWKFSGR